MREAAFASLLVFGLSGQAVAQTDGVSETAAMEAMEAGVPPQDWYPEGYYDVRIAAEAQLADYPRPLASLLKDAVDGTGRRYDLVDCEAEKVDADPGDPVAALHGDTALETARIRSELARLHFPASLYADPLLAFERTLIGDDAAKAPATKRLDAYRALAAAMEANRLRSAPTLPGVHAGNECRRSGGATRGFGLRPPTASVAPRRPVGVIVRTEPAGGEILLVNAFAFKVCTRKTPDPWDRFACKWNEVQTGVARPLSGRFVYQVRWPDGTVRTGTREIVSGEREPVILRKTGS